MLQRLLNLVLAGLLLAAVCGAPSQADDLTAAHFILEVDADQPTGFTLNAQIVGDAGTLSPPTWPNGCAVTAYSKRTSAAGPLHRYTVGCTRRLEATDQIIANWTVTGASLTRGQTPEAARDILFAGPAGYSITILDPTRIKTSPLAQAASYLQQGVIHILEGWDHLAFVLCLCLLSRGRQLILLITAFTFGHSISLILASLGVIDVPMPPVEAVIALSIAFMAREALLHLRGVVTASRSPRQFFWIVAAFGLLHGLGFASALGELSSGTSVSILSMLFFNLGVEIGQLIFVGAVMAVFAGLSLVNMKAFAQTTAAWIAGLAGAYWTIERVYGLAMV